MPYVSSIYDSAPMQPIAKIKENLSIWTRTVWEHYKIEYIEPMPRSSPLEYEAVVGSGATTLAANGVIQKVAIAALTLNEGEFIHLRWEPIDDVEGILWEQSATGRFVTRGAQSRVDIRTRFRDPYLATTTFFILGQDRNIQLEVRNPIPVAQPSARFQFWGFRYVLSKYSAAESREFDSGRKPTTWLPAEGRPGGGEV